MAELFDFTEFPVLETPRLLMRELQPEDAPALFPYYSDPEFTRYIGFDTHNSVEDTTSMIQFMHEIYAQKDSVRWGIVLNTTGQLIGTAGLHFWKRDIGSADVGYHIGRAYWGQGYASEVLGAMIVFGFECMHLNRLAGYHNVGNEASGRVMQKHGFSKEGVWRQSELKNGRLIDKVWYSLLRHEWQQA